MPSRDYPVFVEQLLAPDDGPGFLAYAPDLPGCMSDGETAEEAMTNIQDAIRCWIDAAEELGRPIPEPTIPPT